MRILHYCRRQLWFTRAFGGNPLLRWTDRAEAAAILAAVLILLATVPVLASATGGLYRSHADTYRAQAQTRQTVTATVIEVATTRPRPHLTTIRVLALWIVGRDGARGGENDMACSSWISVTHTVRSGDHMDIWIDDFGMPAATPTPLRQAAFEAVGYAAGTATAMVAALASVITVVRTQLERIRRTRWQREIERLTNGRSDRSL
jgi:hypothetical protein